MSGDLSAERTAPLRRLNHAWGKCGWSLRGDGAPVGARDAAGDEQGGPHPNIWRRNAAHPAVALATERAEHMSGYVAMVDLFARVPPTRRPGATRMADPSLPVGMKSSVRQRSCASAFLQMPVDDHPLWGDFVPATFYIEWGGCAQ